MRKYFACVLLSITAVFALTFSACGRDYSKVVGIEAVIGTTSENAFYYNNDLFNNRTVAKNDYILQVGESYSFCIECIATRGSRYPELNAEYLCFYYDEDVLEIVHSAEDAREAEYTLICKTIVEYTAVTVEVDEFSCTVIISAY